MNVHSFIFVYLHIQEEAKHMRDQLKDKEKALLKAILYLVNNKGFHASSMAKIAKMAGISAGTIYLYFENKQDMLDKLYLFIKSEMCEYAFKKHIPDGDIQEEFRKIWYRIAQYKSLHVEEAMFLAFCDISPVVSEEVKEKALTLFDPFLEICRRGQAEGRMRKDSLHLIYAFSINPLSYLISVKRDKKLKLSKEQIDTAYEMVWNAIRTDNNEI